MLVERLYFILLCFHIVQGGDGLELSLFLKACLLTLHLQMIHTGRRRFKKKRNFGEVESLKWVDESLLGIDLIVRK